MKADPLVRGLMFCYMTNTLMTIIITKYWKISIHAMGVAEPLAALWIAGFQFPLIAIAILVSVSYSRVLLKAHTGLQVTAGSIAGFVITYGQLYFFLYNYVCESYFCKPHYTDSWQTHRTGNMDKIHDGRCMGTDR